MTLLSIVLTCEFSFHSICRLSPVMVNFLVCFTFCLRADLHQESPNLSHRSPVCALGWSSSPTGQFYTLPDSALRAPTGFRANFMFSAWGLNPADLVSYLCMYIVDLVPSFLWEPGYSYSLGVRGDTPRLMDRIFPGFMDRKDDPFLLPVSCRRSSPCSPGVWRPRRATQVQFWISPSFLAPGNLPISPLNSTTFWLLLYLIHHFYGFRVRDVTPTCAQPVEVPG